MHYPSTRLFTLIEILQGRGTVTGTEIAHQLEVDGRTVRRYVTRLQEMGVPIETVKGRYGGYRLEQSFRMPPLFFQSDEVLALAMGLMFTRRLHLAGIASISERAINKIERVMPISMVEQIQTFNNVVHINEPDWWYDLSADLLFSLSRAVETHKTVWIRYGDRNKQQTGRKVDPYAIVFMIGMWYLAGYCHLRQAIRVFRLDRVREIKTLSIGFVPPDTFDAAAYVEAAIARTPGTWRVRVLFKESVDQVKAIFPKAIATFYQTPAGTEVQILTSYLRRTTLFLLQLQPECEFEILGPPAVIEELGRITKDAAMLARGSRASS